MNVICLLGRLTATPEEKTTPTGITVTSFSVAVDRPFKAKNEEQRQADFINCVAWRNTAEFICRYCQKGQRIALQGSLQVRSYTDKEGNRRTAYEVVVDNAYFADSKGGGQAQEKPVFTAPTGVAVATGFEDIVTDDDLPF